MKNNNSTIIYNTLPINMQLKNYLQLLDCKNFSNINEELVNQLVEEINESLKDEKNYETRLLYVLTLFKRIYFIKRNIRLTDEEKILMLIKIFDPNCYTYKMYLNVKIPDIKQYADEVYKQPAGFLRNQAYEQYMSKKYEKEKAIDVLRTKLINLIGIYIPAIIKYERIYLNSLRKNEPVKEKVEVNKKDVLLKIEYLMSNISSIQKLGQEEENNINTELQTFKNTTEDISLNSIIEYVFSSKLNSISERFYFFINALELVNCKDSLSYIIEWNGTWQAMNDDLQKNYGIKSRQLLELRMTYNKMYK